MICVPRPAPHLPRTLLALQQAGFSALEPLALSLPHTLPTILPPQATAIIFTSPIGVQSGFTHLPAFCVGSATAEAARNNGYTIAYTGTNNGVSMAQDLARHPTADTRHHFIHFHGDHAGMDWHTILQQAGHSITPLLTYKTHRITHLPRGFTNPAVTLLFSAGSASHLANLLKHANMQPHGTAIALSPAVARAASLHWPRVVTAPQPTLASMVETLQAHQG